MHCGASAPLHCRFEDATPEPYDLMVDLIGGIYAIIEYYMHCDMTAIDGYHMHCDASVLLHRRFEDATAEPYDLVVDLIGGDYEWRSLPLLKRSGHFANILNSGFLHQ